MQTQDHPDIERALRTGEAPFSNRRCSLCGANSDELQPLSRELLCESCCAQEQERITKELCALLEESELPFEPDEAFELVSRSFERLRYSAW